MNVRRLPVVFVFLLISFLGYSSQIFIIWPWYGHEFSVELLTLLLPFNVSLAMLLFNYYLCVTTSPGLVPASWSPDLQSTDGYEVKKLTGAPRFCRTCEKYKPPRAHHCKECNICTLRMDHHCFWTGNCIGHFNYGHFIRFLFYVDISCSYHLIMLIWSIRDAMYSSHWDVPSTRTVIFTVLNLMLCVPVLLLVGGFSLYHFHCLLRNTTTIEGLEKNKMATLVRRGKVREIKFPYDLGWRRNIESVLGPKPLLWCWPTITPGTGLKYQLANGDESDVHWIPQQEVAHDHRSEVNDHLVLPPSPWTYGNESFNPALRPSNAQSRLLTSGSVKRRNGGSAVPPYHPDYHESALIDSSDSSDESDHGAYAQERWGEHVRRGSEGYEVKPLDREEIFRHHIENQLKAAGRYRTYAPEPDDNSYSDPGKDEASIPSGTSNLRADPEIF